MADIKEELRKVRRGAKLTQWELSAACKDNGKAITGITISKYELGKTSPTVAALETIAKATGSRLIIAFHKNPSK